MQMIFMCWVGALFALQLTFMIDSKVTLQAEVLLIERMQTLVVFIPQGKYIPCLLYTPFGFDTISDSMNAVRNLFT